MTYSGPNCDLTKNGSNVFVRDFHGLSNAVYCFSLSGMVLEILGGGVGTRPSPSVRRWFIPPSMRMLIVGDGGRRRRGAALRLKTAAAAAVGSMAGVGPLIDV